MEKEHLHEALSSAILISQEKGKSIKLPLHGIGQIIIEEGAVLVHRLDGKYLRITEDNLENLVYELSRPIKWNPVV